MDVSLSLRDTRELFEQPARTPLDPDYEPWCAGPAVDYIVSTLKADPGARVVLELPAGRDPSAVRAALERYSHARAGELTRENPAQSRSGPLGLLPTGLLFADSLARSRLADS